jgi:hypothetical protein
VIVPSPSLSMANLLGDWLTGAFVWVGSFIDRIDLLLLCSAILGPWHFDWPRGGATVTDGMILEVMRSLYVILLFPSIKRRFSGFSSWLYQNLLCIATAMVLHVGY